MEVSFKRWGHSMLTNSMNQNITEILQAQAKNTLLNDILNESSQYLKGSQIMELNKTLNKQFQGYEIFVLNEVELHENYNEENREIMEIYLKNKELEGLSPKTIIYYKDTINEFLTWIDKHLSDVTTQDMREYLSYRQNLNNCSNVTLDNLRRNLNAFFNTINQEGYIQSNPMARIKKIKSAKKVKKPFTEMEIELMRNKLQEKPENTNLKQYTKLQDLALFELLLSSGIRLNELIQLDKDDVDLERKTLIVLGKGNKERTCYFSTRAQYYLDKIINFQFKGRNLKYSNQNPLFLSIKRHDKSNRILRSGIELKIRELGKSVGVKAHPHKFRRTFATNLVNKGVPIEQVKELLGHSSLDTTLIYAMVDQDQVKYNHSRYAG